MMIQKKQEPQYRPLRLDSPATGIPPATDSFALAARSILDNSRTPTGKEQAIGHRVRLNLCEQVGTVIVAEHASHLVNQSAMRMEERIDQFIDFEREIRQKERHEEDQAHMEAIGHRVRERVVSAQLAIQSAAVNKFAELVDRPLQPEDGEGATLVIEDEPGPLWGLIGRKRVTRVVR